MTKYWTKRIELFGSNVFERILTLKASLKDDQIAIGTDIIQILQWKDKKGHVVTLMEPEDLDSSKYTEESMVGTTW